jgi:hypothetical protein
MIISFVIICLAVFIGHIVRALLGHTSLATHLNDGFWLHRARDFADARRIVLECRGSLSRVLRNLLRYWLVVV